MVVMIQNQGWNKLDVKKLRLSRKFRRRILKSYIIKTVRGRYGFATIKNHGLNKLNVKKCGWRGNRSQTKGLLEFQT